MPDSAEQPDSQGPVISTVLFYHRHQRVLATPLDTRLEIGRQRASEPSPPRRLDRSDSARIILAPLDDVDVSRSHMQLTSGPDKDSFEVTNLSYSQPIRISPDILLLPGEKKVTELPLLAQFSTYAVRVEPAEEEDLELQPLPERTIAPGKLSVESGLNRLNIDTMDEQLLLRWLETVLGVFQSAANSRDFPELAAKALVKIVGLDAAAMLQCDSEGRWRTAALHSVVEGQNEDTWIPSQTLLAQVRKEKRTYRHVPANAHNTAQSLQNISALVSAPILDGDENVIGALYGDRRSEGPSDDIPDITLFEAKLVEVLASGIAAGLARVKEEKSAVAARVQLEQFVTPQVASQLEKDPQLLEGRDAEITVVFADIRGFSRVSERLGPERTMAWIQDTMGTLSDCVLACDGVLVDYLGDELMAMWGAPIAQADHADLACMAARKMMLALPEINQRWEEELGVEMRVGIGINSGICRVGNTGSRQRLKYGPLGDSVNVASRVQGATKYLGADCLITRWTLKTMNEKPRVRRLAKVRVVNIENPVDLYELHHEPPKNWPERCDRYEKALAALEKKELDKAKELSEHLKVDYPEDAAAASLTQRVVESLLSEGGADTAIWHLPGK